MKVKYWLMIAGVAVLLPAFCRAAQISEEEIVPRNKMIYIEPSDEKTFLERGRLKNIVGVTFGYDNNSHLDSQRDADAFNQLYYRATFISPLTRDKRVDGILEYELMSLLYAGEANLDIIKNGFHAGIDNRINEEFEFLTGYYLDTFSYINQPSDNFYENRVDAELRQNLPHKIVHGLRYELAFKNYTDKHTRITAAVDTDKKRNDLRNTVEYSIGKYFAKDFPKLSFQYYGNSSNETYIKYYNYNSYKLSASLTHLFNEKFFAYGSLARQFRAFGRRTITTDALSKEWDRTYLITAALYYNFNKALSTGLSYTYRQNWSNEPVENYSGSLISLTTYYRF